MALTKINPSLAIGTVIRNKDNKILFVQEKRDKDYEKAKDIWGLPSGKVDWNEPIIDGLKRELREELNIEIKPVGLIGVYQYSRDDSQCLGLAFLGEILGEIKGKSYNTEELKDIKWLTLEEALNPVIFLRYGSKEVLEDYQKNIILPLEFIHFFDLRKLYR